MPTPAYQAFRYDYEGGHQPYPKPNLTGNPNLTFIHTLTLKLPPPTNVFPPLCEPGKYPHDKMSPKCAHKHSKSQEMSTHYKYMHAHTHGKIKIKEKPSSPYFFPDSSTSFQPWGCTRWRWWVILGVFRILAVPRTVLIWTNNYKFANIPTYMTVRYFHIVQY